MVWQTKQNKKVYGLMLVYQVAIVDWDQLQFLYNATVYTVIIIYIIILSNSDTNVYAITT